ncbi:MAG: DNA polymerase III subunit delta [bacterium]|nr:DNA polymerase III subunit delta [bacterium]
MAANFDSVYSELKKGNYSPVYFLQGEEPYFTDRIVDYIEANALEESQKGFNQIILYGKDVEMSAVINNARRFPMMSDRQVVIVKEAQEIKDFNKEVGAKLLENYLANPQPSTILVFAYKYKNVDKRKAIGKLIEKQTVSITSKKLYDNQIPGFIKSYFGEKEFPVTEKAIQMLADFIGNNLSRLSNEIDKMLLNFGEKVKIEDSHVSKYVGISKEYNVFELQKSISFKQILKANQIINYFQANPKSNPAILVIFNLFNYFNKLLLIHGARMKNTHQGKNEIASLIGVSPFFVDEYMTAAKNYPVQKVMQNLAFIRQADMMTKGVGASGNVTEGYLLKELIFKLMH